MIWFLLIIFSCLVVVVAFEIVPKSYNKKTRMHLLDIIVCMMGGGAFVIMMLLLCQLNTLIMRWMLVGFFVALTGNSYIPTLKAHVST